MKMKIAVTGHKGRVGRHLLRRDNVVPLECDITNSLEIERAIKYTKPDIVVHLAEKSDVDYCEKKENEGTAILSNVRGTCYIAEAVERYGCGMVLLSSDHVFNGKKWWGRYKENDKLNPVNYYGITKVAAEAFSGIYDHFKIVRASYLFDSDRMGTHKAFLPAAYPSFIKRSFLYIPHFVNLLYEYCQRFDEQPNILHLSGSRTVSWQQFMRDFALMCNYDADNIVPSKEELKDNFAPRGRNLGLDISLSRKLGFVDEYSYLDGLREMARNA